MPVIFHTDIRNQKTGQLSVFHKRYCHKGTYIIHTKISDGILMFQKTVTDFWHGKPLWIFQHGVSDSFDHFLRNFTLGVVIKYMCPILMVTDVQCTIQTEMIHECIKGILYHCLYIASAHINQLLPCGNKLHLSAGGCIILEKSFLFNQQFDIFFLHRTRFRMLSQIDLLQQIHWK